MPVEEDDEHAEFRKGSGRYMPHYGYYRARFTPGQRALYEDILKGRERNPLNEAQAVDLVMRETLNPGV